MKTPTPASVRRAALALLGACLPAVAGAAPCLVGTWEPIGNAAAEWMQKNAPGARLAIDRQQAAISFRADGTYATDAAVDATVSSAAGGSARTRGTRFQASGTWSTEGDTLVMKPSRESVRGDMEVAGPNGARIRVPLPSGAPQVQRLQYRCAGAGMETRMAIPNATPIVQRYRRKDA